MINGYWKMGCNTRNNASHNCKIILICDFQK
jgi:hypothetical protein